MEDSNNKRPARAAADVTDINDDVCDTTSEGTHITFLGKETLHPYKLKMIWERQTKWVQFMALLSHSYIQCELLQFDQETQAVRPKSVSLQKKGQPLKTFFQEKLKSEEQLAWRAVSIKLHVNVMLRKYSLHPNKRRDYRLP